jgi:hypothetical protein
MLEYPTSGTVCVLIPQLNMVFCAAFTVNHFYIQVRYTVTISIIAMCDLKGTV